MDRKALEYTQRHYDGHSRQFQSEKEALRARSEGPGFPLKQYHNQVKRHLIAYFARGCTSLLDLACGRGGDLQKWADTGIQYVKGVDLSPGEIEEAKGRYAELQRRRRDLTLVADFVATPELGLTRCVLGRVFDIVTCMFAIHYFFVSEKALHQFLQNVAVHLRCGGYFVGTVPDGKRVMNTLQAGGTWPELRAPMLRLAARWTVSQPFGSAYMCAIGDTVTAGATDPESAGSLEYLVYFKVFTAIAAKHGLAPVGDWGELEAQGLFEEADTRADFKHFAPRFPPHADPSLSTASRLFAAFAFRKLPAEEAAARPCALKRPAEEGSPSAAQPLPSKRRAAVQRPAEQDSPGRAGLDRSRSAALTEVAASVGPGANGAAESGSGNGERPHDPSRAAQDGSAPVTHSEPDGPAAAPPADAAFTPGVSGAPGLANTTAGPAAQGPEPEAGGQAGAAHEAPASLQAAADRGTVEQHDPSASGAALVEAGADGLPLLQQRNSLGPMCSR